MLRRITITNYLLIDRLELELSEGFTAITGETGSGKSILIGALGLAMGGRAGAAIDDALDFIRASNRRIARMEARAARESLRRSVTA